MASNTKKLIRLTSKTMPDCDLSFDSNGVAWLKQPGYGHEMDLVILDGDQMEQLMVAFIDHRVKARGAVP